MSRLKILSTTVLLAAFTSVRAFAAHPVLPPEVVAADTIAVVHIDAGHFNPDMVHTAATTILGPNAVKVEESLNKFKEQFDKASAAGAEAMTMVVGAKKKEVAGADPAAAPEAANSGNGVMYVHLKPGADVKTIESMITENMSPEDKGKTVFDQAGDYLAVHKKDQEFPSKPDAARQTMFSDALGTVSDASIQIAFIPDQATRDEMIKSAANGPKSLKDAAPLLAKAKWMTVAVALGNAPSIAMTANTTGADDAKTLTDAINSAIADGKAQAANPGPNAGIMALAGPMISQLLDGLKPAANGSQVTVTIGADTMKQLANFAANLGILGGPAGPGAPR